MVRTRRITAKSTLHIIIKAAEIAAGGVKIHPCPIQFLPFLAAKLAGRKSVQLSSEVEESRICSSPGSECMVHGLARSYARINLIQNVRDRSN